MTKLNKSQITDDHISKFIMTDPRCRRVLIGNCRDREYLSDIAHTKRFLERYVADDKFRKLLKDNPTEAGRRYGLKQDPEAIRLLWDADSAQEFSRNKKSFSPLQVRRYRLFIHEKIVHRERMRVEECLPVNRDLRRWRERQISRSWTQFGEAKARAMVHPTVIFELSKGCSVGCWFCGFSAGAKEADYLYTRENARLWRDVLRVFREISGPSAAGGVCYWATDPLDNPDYEKFCRDYARILGRFPQTTTAQAHKYVKRMKKLLKLSRSMGGVIDRFSVLSLEIFNRINEEFTAEEILYVEILTQNMESKTMLASAGRARHDTGLRKKARRLDIPDEKKLPPSSIACLSGFLVNMIDRSVRLIAPCPSDDKWPEGYWILEEGTFSSGEELKELLLGMIKRKMPVALGPDSPVAFRGDLTHSEDKEGFLLTTDYTRSTFRGGNYNSGISEMIASGNYTAGEIALSIEAREGIDPVMAFHVMNRLFRDGFLNEDPDYFYAGTSR